MKEKKCCICDDAFACVCARCGLNLIRFEEKDYENVENQGLIQSVEEIFEDFRDGNLSAKDAARLSFRICKGLNINKQYAKNIGLIKDSTEGGKS
jgi:hypothetical protein